TGPLGSRAPAAPRLRDVRRSDAVWIWHIGYAGDVVGFEPTLDFFLGPPGSVSPNTAGGLFVCLGQAGMGACLTSCSTSGGSRSAPQRTSSARSSARSAYSQQ